jgi:hypothetical protein
MSSWHLGQIIASQFAGVALVCGENLQDIRRGPDKDIEAHHDKEVPKALLQSLLRHLPRNACTQKAACYTEAGDD